MEAKVVLIRDCAFQDGSYPCGNKDGDKLPDCNLCYKIRQAGIKEVVEFANQVAGIKHNPEWQAKVKNWEVE